MDQTDGKIDAGMEGLINALLQADDAAQAKLRENQRRRQHMADAMAEEREEIQRKNTEEAQERIDTIRLQHQQEYDEQIVKMESKYQSALSELEKNFNAHHEEWVESLLRRCLS